MELPRHPFPRAGSGSFLPAEGDTTARGILAVLLACAAVLWWRRPDALATPQFWAEDGVVFFVQARDLGWRAFLEPYAGYFHLLPRLVAATASGWDPLYAPLTYVLAAGIATLHVCALALIRPLATWRGRAWMAALAVVLVPDAREVLWVLTNVQWILAPGLLLVLLGRAPQGLPGRAHDVVTTVLFGLTGPFVIVLAPLFVLRAWRERSHFTLALAGAAAGTALVQILPASGTLVQMARLGPDWPQLGAAAGLRLWDSLLLGGRLVAPGNLATGWFLLLLGATVSAVLILPGRPAARERGWLLAVAATWLGLGLLRCQEFAPLLFRPGIGARYFFPGQLLLLWLGLAAFGAAGAQGRRLGWLVCGAFAGTNATRWQEEPLADLNWPRVAAELRAGRAVEARIHPDWRLHLAGADTPGGIAAGLGSPRVPLPPLEAQLVAGTTELRPEGDRIGLLGYLVPPADYDEITWKLTLPPDWVLLQVESPLRLDPIPLPGTSGEVRLRFSQTGNAPFAFTVWVSYPPDAPAAEMQVRVIRRHGDREQTQALPPLRWRAARP